MTTTIQTSHKTFNKTFNKTLKREIKALIPSAASFKKLVANYKPIYLIKNDQNEIVARVEKSDDLFKGLVILKN